MYLYIFQQRLCCVRYGCQEGALQAAGKDFQSIRSDGQTCCKVVQSNLSDSGLGGHSVKWIMGCEHIEVFILRAWDLQFHWLLFISCTEDVILISGVKFDHIK
jgi:hypothetical protein